MGKKKAAPVKASPSAFGPGDTGLEDLNFYERLGVTQDASQDEIKRAYRKLAVQNHPDRAKKEDQDLATVKMQQLNEAHAALKDITARNTYNRWLAAGGDGRFDAEGQDFNIPWDHSGGWPARWNNFKLIAVLGGGLLTLLLREVIIKWTQHVHATAFSLLDIFFLGNTNFLHLNIPEGMLMLYAAWHFGVGEDYYFQWLCTIMVCWGALAKCVHLLASADPAEKDRDPDNEKTMEILMSLCLFTYWFIYGGGGFINSMMYSSGVASIMALAFSLLGPEYETNGEYQLAIAMLCFGGAVLWGLQDSFWWRTFVGLYAVYSFVRSLHGTMKIVKDKNAYPWLIIASVWAVFYSFYAHGFFYTVVYTAALLVLQQQSAFFFDRPLWIVAAVAATMLLYPLGVL